MGMRRLRASALAGLLVAGLLVAPAFAQAPAAAPPPANRLALVIGEAAYNGDALPTAGQDAALMAQTLGADGFDVTELHDLNTPDLAAKYQAFLAKVAAAPPGAAVTVYLAGLGVAVGCDDYLLPVDAEIRAASDVPPIALSMTRVMNDLAQTSSQLRLVMLDGARPIPPSVSAASFPRGLIPLNPPAATTFGISAEIHDFEAPPKQGDANDAYASAFALVAQQPLTDVETAMRQVRVVAHQATSGAQTPWQATNIVMPPFTFPLNADPAQMQAAAANLPSSTAALSTLDVESAYWAAIWRNSIPDYQAYLAAFSTSAPADEAARITQLLALLQQPNPQCQAAAAPPPPPPLTVIAGPACPDGFVPQDGFNGAYCVPLAPPPVLQCPPGFSTIVTDDGMACSPWIPPPVLTCPPFFHVFGAPPYCVPDQPPPFCPPGFRPIWHDGVLTCVRGGPLPPGCPIGAHPIWTGEGYVCVGNPPPPINCGAGRPDWRDGGWICVNPPAPPCPNGQIAKWANGRLICGVVIPGGQPHCPRGYAPSGPGGTLCAPVRAPLGLGNPPCLPGAAGCPPNGAPPKGTLAPLKCANGQLPLPGKGCAVGPGAPPTPTPGACPPGMVKGAKGCEPLRPVKPTISVQPTPTPTPTPGACPPGTVRGAKGCEPLRPVKPTISVQPTPTPTPTPGACPPGTVRGAKGCEPLRLEKPVAPLKPAPVVTTPPPVVHPAVVRPVTPPKPAVVKPRPACGGPREPPCPK
jgi:uncharacterized caspase-like protein